MNKYTLTVALVLLLSVLVDAGVTRFPSIKRDFCCDSDSFLSFMPGFSKSWCCDRDDRKMHDSAAAHNKPSEIHHHQHHRPTPTMNQQQQYPSHPQQQQQQQEASPSHYTTRLDSTPATIIVNINNPTPLSTTTTASSTSTKAPEGDAREHCKKLDEKGCSSDERCYWEDSPSEAGKSTFLLINLLNDKLMCSSSSHNAALEIGCYPESDDE